MRVYWILLSTRNPSLSRFSIYNVYVSPHVCKSNDNETKDVDFLPWRTAYFGLTTGGAPYCESPELG